MEDLLDTSPCYFFSFADDGRIRHVNTTVCNALGYTKEALESEPVERIFTVATRIFYQTHFFPLLRMQGSANEIFITLETKGKEHLPVLLNAKRTNDPSPLNICIGIMVPNRKKFEDELVAARKSAETMLKENTELAKARAELGKHSEKLDQSLYKLNLRHNELKQFSKIVTHDLQEPIRKLLYFTGLLSENREKLPAETSMAVNKVIAVTERMRAIVAALQQYMWITETEIHPTSTDLNECVAAALNELHAKFNNNNWEVIAEPLTSIDGDPVQLKKLFSFVLENSIRHKKPDEKVIIRIQATILQKNIYRAIEGKYRYTDSVRIQITDNGKGFDPAYKQSVFELFTKLHRGPETGIGLSLCKKIVEQHNGEIYANSKVGEGTTITIILPLRQL